METVDQILSLIRTDEEFDLGHGHVFSPVVDQKDRLVGWMHTHPDARNPSALPCKSFCAIREGLNAPVHRVVQAKPLTLTPSLECRVCKAHGHVKDGKWEPC